MNQWDNSWNSIFAAGSGKVKGTIQTSIGGIFVKSMCHDLRPETGHGIRLLAKFSWNGSTIATICNCTACLIGRLHDWRICQWVTKVWIQALLKAKSYDKTAVPMWPFSIFPSMPMFQTTERKKFKAYGRNSGLKARSSRTSWARCSLPGNSRFSNAMATQWWSEACWA